MLGVSIKTGPRVAALGIPGLDVACCVKWHRSCLRRLPSRFISDFKPHLEGVHHQK